MQQRATESRHREWLIYQYNTAVDDWNNEYLSQFSKTLSFYYSVTLNRDPDIGINGGFTLTNHTNPPIDDKPRFGEVFKTYTPYKFNSMDLSVDMQNLKDVPNASFTFRLIDNSANVVMFAQNDWIPFIDSVLPVFCNDSEIARYNGNNTACVEAKCTAQSGVFNGSDSSCHYEQFPAHVCVKVIWSPLGWEAEKGDWDGDIGGCRWNVSGFAEMTTNLTGAPVFISIKHAKDPFIVLNELTLGTLNFGDRDGREMLKGFLMRVIGGLITIAGLLLFIGSMKCVQESLCRRQIDYDRVTDRITYTPIAYGSHNELSPITTKP